MTEQQAEPVACRFCHSKKGSWTWQCYKCGEIDDVQKPAPPPVQEPLTKNEALTLEALQYAAAKGYGLGGMKIGRFIIKETLAQAKQEDAFEGWVKIDEMRKHFDAVNCGTIYKDGGEGRVPLYTAPPQQQAEPPPEWLLIKNILDEYGLQALDFVAEFKAAQQVATIWKQPKQQAPFSPEVINTTQTAWKMGYEAAKAEQQQAEPVAWDKPSASFDEWWDGDRRRDTANPFTTDSFSYWAFEGWQAALAQPVQEPLTVEEIEAIGDRVANEQLVGPVSNFRVRFAQAIEQTLKDKNHG